MAVDASKRPRHGSDDPEPPAPRTAENSGAAAGDAVPAAPENGPAAGNAEAEKPRPSPSPAETDRRPNIPDVPFDETDAAWGEYPQDSDDWLRQQRPPHHGG
jgi:hypothetical protein